MSDKQHQTTDGSEDHWRLAEAAASLLLAAWQDPAKALPALPAELKPRNALQAYTIQQAVMPALGRIGGWKVGASGPGEDATFNCAPMPLSNFHTAPARLSAARYTLRGVEAEISVRFKADLETRGDHLFTREEVLAAVESCHPAIEVLQSRFQDPDAQDKLSLLADFNTHGAFVFGPEIPGWRERDWTREEARMLVGGQEKVRHAGNPAGEMVRMLVWMANHGTRWAGGLRAGQFVTTGSWTGKTPVPAGGTARAAFSTAGALEVTFGEGVG